MLKNGICRCPKTKEYTNFVGEENEEETIVNLELATSYIIYTWQFAHGTGLLGDLSV